MDGLLSDIKNDLGPWLDDKRVKAVYLHGSQAEGRATNASDIDLAIHCSLTYQDKVRLIKHMRQAGKKYDLHFCADADIQLKLACAAVITGQFTSIQIK